MKFDIDYQNYDRIFKKSFSIFKDKIIEFLGIELPQIESFVETEFVDIETSEERLDLNFWLKDGSILHLEEEVDIDKDDLIRFAAYDLRLFKRYQQNIRTIVLCINGFEDSIANFYTGSLRYTVTIVDMSERDGDLKIKEIKEKIENGQNINILELVFLPLMESKKDISDQVKKAIDLEKQLNLSVVKESKVVGMTLAVTDKFLDEQEIEEIWREYKMLRIFKKAIDEGKKEGLEKGLEEGLEKGIEKGKEEGLQEMAIKLMVKKFKKLPGEYKEKIKEKDVKELEVIIEEILEIDSLDELKEYL